MTLLKGLGTGLCVTVLCLLVAPKAKADEWDRKTVITFSGPVEVPGVGQHVLPAGTYVFKILDAEPDRHIVQIFNQDESQVLTTIIAIPNLRLRATDKTVITFRERPAGEPEALRAWFYPGHEWGDEFVYPRSRAIQLAKETSGPVLSTPVEIADSTPEALKTAPVEAVNETGNTVDTATVVEAPPAPAPTVTAAPVLTASLPKTGSDLPLIGLAGLLALSGGLVLTGLLKQSA
jgi:LPXTG-motif cell wall-anchored protein